MKVWSLFSVCIFRNINNYAWTLIIWWKRKIFIYSVKCYWIKNRKRKALDISQNFFFLDQILSCDKIDMVEIKCNFIYTYPFSTAFSILKKFWELGCLKNYKIMWREYYSYIYLLKIKLQWNLYLYNLFLPISFAYFWAWNYFWKSGRLVLDIVFSDFLRVFSLQYFWAWTSKLFLRVTKPKHVLISLLT